MSYSWSFHSFAERAFREVFGRCPAEKVSAFQELVAPELGSGPELIHALWSALTSGISYEGMSPKASRAMDEVIRFAFSPEGFEAELKLEHISPDGVHPSVIAELIQRLNAPKPLLAGLLRGRRYGQTEPADCGYCIFGPEEVSVVLQEVRAACAADFPWSAEYLPELVQECLVEPFAAAEGEVRPVFCHLG